jgi:putative PIN family toxin of toxin-antitoxin system
MTPVICRETAIELIRVLDKPKFKLDRHMRDEVLNGNVPYAEKIILPDPLPVLPVACRDRDDELFIHLALVAKADYLVTGDADLLALRGLVPFEIVTVDQLKMRFL